MHLTRSNLSQAFTHNNCPLTAQELDVIWEGLDKLPDGRASAQHLIRLVTRQESANQSVFLKIGSIVEQRRINVANLFGSHDIDRDNKLTRSELENALRSLRIALTEFEYRAIFTELDRSREGKILISELISSIMKKPVSIDSNELQWAAGLFSKIKESLNSMRIDALQYFRRFNVDPQGLINVKDFRDALLKLGVDPGSIEGQRLVNQFQIPNVGKIKFADFEWALKNTKANGPVQVPFKLLNQAALDHLYQCLDFIGDCIKKDFGNTNNLIQKIDPRSSGFIQFEDLRKIILNELKIPSEDDVYQDLCLLLDDGSGKIPIIRFVDAVSGVRIEQIKRQPPRNDRNPNIQPPFRGQNSLPPARATPDAQNVAGLLGINPQRSGNLNQTNLFQTEQISGTNSQMPTGPQRNTYVKLDEFLRQNTMSIVNIFGRNSGIISRDVFIQSIRAQKLPLSQEDLDFVCKTCAAQQDLNKIELDRFVQNLRQAQTRPDTRSEPPRSIIRDPRQDLRNPQRSTPAITNPSLAKLNEELLRAGLTAEEVFSRYDTDGDGVLSKPEFLTACTDFGFSLDRQAIEAIFDQLDSSKNGSISINEFAIQVPGARMNAEARTRNIDLGQQFENEIMDLFKMLDLDKDGFLDYNEISQALKAYCIVPNAQQLRETMRRIDINGNGKIEQLEFKQFMEDMIKKNVMEQEDELQDLRIKFQQADFMKLGYLTAPQLLTVLQQMKCDVTEEELSHLINLADTNHDGKIDIDEFMLLMVGANPEIYNDDKASAVLFNIRKSRNINPLDFLKAFSGMPRHFSPSFIAEKHKMRKNLPSQGISPTLDSSGIQFKDISNTVVQSKLQSATHLKQNEIEAGGYIVMERASGISIPDASIVSRANILKRVVRISTWHAEKMDYIGNSCHIEANWREDMEDRWAFELPQDKDYNIIAARIGKGFDPTKVSIVFEFLIVMLKESTTVEFSCGFAQVSYQNLMLRNDHRLQIEGGSPGNPQEVANEDVRTFRKG